MVHTQRKCRWLQLANSNIDAMVNYTENIIHLIGSDETILRYLSNNPALEADSDEADDTIDRYIFNYDYVDGTTVETAAYICVETEMVNAVSPTMQSYKLFVKVVCHKEFMKIDPSLFPGVMGNRRDVLLTWIDKLLNKNSSFGIGKLILDRAVSVNAPNNFSARELTYSIPDFSDRKLSST